MFNRNIALIFGCPFLPHCSLIVEGRVRQLNTHKHSEKLTGNECLYRMLYLSYDAH